MLEFIEKTYTNAVINVIGSISTKKQKKYFNYYFVIDNTSVFFFFFFFKFFRESFNFQPVAFASNDKFLLSYQDTNRFFA